MPFYEYQCKSCGHSLEAMQKVSDAPLRKCPNCGKPQLMRLMSAPVFRLKGGGWYETDFKGDQDTKRNLADHAEAEAPKEEAKAADAKAGETGAAASDAPKTPEKKPDKAGGEAGATAAKSGGSARRGAVTARGKPAQVRPAAKKPLRPSAKKMVKKSASRSQRRA